MSLNGALTPFNKQYASLFKTVSIKYIKIINGNKTLHESWTGELPAQEIVNMFLEA